MSTAPSPSRTQHAPSQTAAMISAARSALVLSARTAGTKSWRSLASVSRPGPPPPGGPRPSAAAAALAPAPPPVPGIARPYSATAAAHLSLDEFRDPLPRADRTKGPVGRQWSVTELRRKSFDDLHRLWYVLYKEKNMLLTERALAKRERLDFIKPNRWTKVKRSMAAIKVVLGERKKERLHQRRVDAKEREGGTS